MEVDHRPLREELADQRELIARLVTVMEQVITQLNSIANIMLAEGRQQERDDG